MSSAMPRQGALYDPQFEHDACGIGFVAQLSGEPSHEIVSLALGAVGSMAHRGGVAADGKSGDGAGILTQIPLDFFTRVMQDLGVEYPVEDLAIGMFFLPQDAQERETARGLVAERLAANGLTLLAWRIVPIDPSALGERAALTQPQIEQALIGRSAAARETQTKEQYERELYIIRKQIEQLANKAGLADFSIPSFSCRTLVYKGLLVAPLLGTFFADLRDPSYTCAVALYHQRYSTNTFPVWELAQPFRMLSHNGEINTVRGNAIWMQAREMEWRRSGRAGAETVPASTITAAVQDGGSALAQVAAEYGPVVVRTGSDSSQLDNTLELMVLGGRDIRHAMSILVPEAWERVQDMDPAWRAFYQYNACLMEPWDGPAALGFCDGTVAGLTLDRNGLRPARFLVTGDGLVVCGSEVGIVPVEESRIVRKGKVGPGQMIAVDLSTGTFSENSDIKSWLAARAPYADWLKEETQVLSPAGVQHLSEAEEAETSASLQSKSPLLGELQHAFGYTAEELAVVLRPMLETGQEPVGSMGDDTSAAVFSSHGRALYNYVRQRFAEVTNPPIDSLREELVMSLSFALGRRGNLLEDDACHAHLIRLNSPVLTDEHMAQLRQLTDPAFAPVTLKALWPVKEGSRGMEAALDRLSHEAEAAVADNKVMLIISDRGVNEEYAPIPALLALGAVHQHLIRVGLRTAVSVVVESGEPREVHHLACLIGMGAEAVNPYLALASVRNLAVERLTVKGKAGEAAEAQRTPEEIGDEAEHNYIHALEKGLLKIMSKMGISTVDSYCGAQVFEIVGFADEVVARCFSGVPSRLKGISFNTIAEAILHRHDETFASRLPHVATRSQLPHPGFYKFKKDGEFHTFAPTIVHALQKAAKSGDYADYKAYAELLHDRPPVELRDLLALASEQKPNDDFVPTITPIPVDEVEPIESIVRRFSTAAMSHGSTSIEAHQTLSIAMNRLGGLSNSGEGGEDPSRYGTERNSTIKQVASGRFGVTPAYLASAEELQIKMAQGSKPGEGGQIPGIKVTEEVARNRHTMPGVTLISPPPHHDIYSIEDLAQLIYDLKQVNPRAAVSVKLVAEAGVGTVAAGVAKGGADVVQISGHSGGTGASPLSSIKNAGVNWELGLAEAQQTLVLNHLRGRVRVRVDGGLKTGHDVVVAALLGADEFSFGTTALVAEGCIMARACHNNTCPVGIATQRPELRAKFKGTPEQIIHFLMHIAQDVREVLASLGARTLEEVIGRSDLLRQVKSGVPEADTLDMTPLITRVDTDGSPIRYAAEAFGRIEASEQNLNLLSASRETLEKGTPIALRYEVANHDRTFGSTLSGEIGRRFGSEGMPDGSVTVQATGHAGQSFGAFLAPGVRLLLEGESNDYVGKGMAGGEIAVRPSRDARYEWSRSTIIGNTCLYGATGGALYAAGQAGERFAVRNSGAIAVVEGIGDHGCEYMTGGVVLVLGTTGRNFAAGMTGGVAYVLDEQGNFPLRCNIEMVELSTLDTQDQEDVRALLARHYELTKSPRAAALLKDWKVARTQFWRVQPKGLETPVLPNAMQTVREWAVEAAAR